VDESMWTNELARRTLVRAAPDAEDMTTALLDVAASSPVLREDVATLLARVGPEAAPAVTERLVGAPKRFRWWCIEVLKGYGPGAACAVDELIHVAETQDQWFRALAAKALGEIGPEAAPAASALLKLLEHSYADARAAAARALGKIGRRDERILDALRAATGDKEQKVAEAAAWALEALGG